MTRVQRNVENSTSGLPVSSSYPGFMPPEKDEWTNHRSEMTADVWSSGMLLLWIGLYASSNSLNSRPILKELCFAFHLDEGDPSQRVAKEGILGKYRPHLAFVFFSGFPHQMRLETWDIICSMMVFTISMRPTISEVFDRISELRVI